MNSFRKNLSSSSPSKPSLVPKISSGLQQKTSLSKESPEVNENDYCQELGSKLQNSNRSATKNFMSPTISAASKASAPRKKILAERDEAFGSIFSNTHVQKTPNTDSKDFSVAYYESDDYKQKIFLPNSSPQPYDPLTNYLSPRPRFLRYNPNRRIQILLRGENELRKGEDDGLGVDGSSSPLLESQKPFEEEGSTDAYDSYSLSSQGGSVKSEGGVVKAENEIEEEEDDDIEEVEDERDRLRLNEVLKSMFLFGVLILSTLYISHMNSPIPPPPLQALSDSEESYLLGSSFSDQKEEKKLGFMEVNGEAISMGIENEDMLEHEFWESVKITDNGEKADVSVDEMDNIRKIPDQKAQNSESSGDSHTQFISDLVENQNLKCDVHSACETEVNLERKEEDAGNRILEFLCKDKESEDDAMMKQTERVIDEGIGEKGVDEKEEVEKESNVSDGMDEMFHLQGREKPESTHSSQIQIMLEKMADANTSSDDVPGIAEAVISDEEVHESNFKAVITVAVFSVIAASVVLGFLHLKCRRTSAKNPLPIDQPSSESVLIEKSDSAFPKKEEEIIEKFDDFANPSSSAHDEDTVYEEIYGSKAPPKVELLGEYVVGEFSSSLKSCVAKPKIIEGDESNFSVSQEKKLRSKAASPSFQELPAMDSPSYGGFTSQEKIPRKKKQEGTNGEEVMQVVTTPVRRSSRIRSRSVMSP